jgi:hemerythrin-like domain-containing protein
VLFPAIKNHPDFVLQEIIDEFEEHHEGFREFAREIIEFNHEDNYAKAHKILKQYINDLLDHIAAENEELFVLADNLFSDNEKETIYFKFMDIDMELGEARKKEYEQMITALLV